MTSSAILLRMFAGLEGALKARKKFVDETSEITEGEATGDGGRSTQTQGKFSVMLQGGLAKSPTGFVGE